MHALSALTERDVRDPPGRRWRQPRISTMAPRRLDASAAFSCRRFVIRRRVRAAAAGRSTIDPGKCNLGALDPTDDPCFDALACERELVSLPAIAGASQRCRRSIAVEQRQWRSEDPGHKSAIRQEAAAAGALRGPSQTADPALDTVPNGLTDAGVMFASATEVGGVATTDRASRSRSRRRPVFRSRAPRCQVPRPRDRDTRSSA